MGTMGLPMAGHLLRAGYALTVWNRTAGKTDTISAEGATVAASLVELAENSEVIILCVNRTEDVLACVRDLMKGAKPGTLFVDHSTIAPTGAQAVGKELSDHGFRFVDAPVTGGSMGAQRGQLMIFMGGSEEDVREAQSCVGPYTKRSERLGPVGAGQFGKMANQIAVGGSLLALCESLSFAEKGGLDLSLMREMIAGGAGGSWNFDHLGSKVINRDWTPGFSVKNQRKDFGYCREAAQAIGASIPTTELADSLLATLESEGMGELTTAVLFESYLKMGASD